jgi:hypothetical protein
MIQPGGREQESRAGRSDDLGEDGGGAVLHLDHERDHDTAQHGQAEGPDT